MADLEGAVNFSDGDLTGELGAAAVDVSERPFIIPITESRDGSGKLVYSTTVMFADIVDAYKTGKRILIRSRGFGGEADVEIVSATVTEVSESSTSSGETTSEISRLVVIEGLSPTKTYPKKENALGVETYEFSYGANGATITKGWVMVPSFDVLNSSRSHVGMIIHSTTLDTMQKVIDVYGGTEWQKLEGVFLLGASENHEVGSTGGSEDAVLMNHRHLASHISGGTSSSVTSPTIPVQPTLEKATIKYASGSNSFKAVTNVELDIRSQSHSHSINGGTVLPVNVDSTSTGALVVSEATGKNMPPYKTVYIWERTA